MAKGAGLVLVGVAGIVLLASAASGAEPEKKGTKPPEPKPPAPPSGIKCERTQPGDGKKNGRAEAVKAWQQCLISSGCLRSGEDDGEHGPRTEAASKAYEASGGKCASPASPPPSLAPPSPAELGSKNATYTLSANLLRPSGEQAYVTIAQTKLAAPFGKADEVKAIENLALLADKYNSEEVYGGSRDGEYSIARQIAKGKKETVWQRSYKFQGGGPAEANA